MNVLRAPSTIALARRSRPRCPHSSLHTTPTTTTSSPATTKSPTFLAPQKPHHPRRSPIWKSPLPPAKVKAYDEALSYIRADALALRREITQLKTRFQEESARVVRAGGRVDEEALRRYREKLWTLEVQSEINLPEVRYAFKTGRYPFQRPVYRHLTEQKWRYDGALDLLMERLHQMHVIPDILPAFYPAIDLRVQFPYVAPPPAALLPTSQHRQGHRRTRQRTVHERAREKQGFSTVEPGEYLGVAQTLKPPRIAATVFHNDTRYYTLLMVDPDVPDPQNGTYTTFLHWMQPNIALSATRRIIRIPLPDTSSPDLSSPSPASMPHLPYIPPHPHRGTGYHRYVLLLLPHPFGPCSSPPTAPPSSQTTSRRLDIPIPTDAERVGFSVREFVERWGIDLGSGVPGKGGVLGSGTGVGGGACMWRAVWEEGVGDIWRDVLRVPEPQYGRLPKPDPYAELKTRRRYIG